MPFLPEPLKTGDTIGLITPSSPMFQGRLYQTACTDVTQNAREHKTNGRRSGFSCKDQTLCVATIILA